MKELFKEEKPEKKPKDYSEEIRQLNDKIKRMENQFAKLPPIVFEEARFYGKFQLKDLTSTPATCKVGELCVVSGIVQVCSAADTWTVIGTQT
jgi:hypothetical protein